MSDNKDTQKVRPPEPRDPKVITEAQINVEKGEKAVILKENFLIK